MRSFEYIAVPKHIAEKIHCGETMTVSWHTQYEDIDVNYVIVSIASTHNRDEWCVRLQRQEDYMASKMIK